MIAELRSAIRADFESDDYRARKQVIQEWVNKRQGAAFEEVWRKAQEKEIAVVLTPTGLVFAPKKNGEILGPEEFEKLPEEEHKRVEGRLMMLAEKRKTYASSSAAEK